MESTCTPAGPLKSFIALTGLNLPLAAQERPESHPFSFELHVDQPQSGLKDSIGHGAGGGASWGCVFDSQSKSRLGRAFAIKVGSDQFSDRATRREAHGVGIGPEFTLYFGPELKGAFLSFEANAYAWSLTNRNTGGIRGPAKTRRRSGPEARSPSAIDSRATSAPRRSGNRQPLIRTCAWNPWASASASTSKPLQGGKRISQTVVKPQRGGSLLS